ncbi:nucleotide sugar dehydrogenase [Halomarina ordinaria]|uniref:UDP-N-acetyl-D-mannosamine dehydrogenase n=1 Tax=Halomarina ordinaria TaxID=3033939 RepID=A0ABD5U707_9EURY|nr:nucleotide sugar dehydrogenase [Halomarina sp. PSRA2]
MTGRPDGPSSVAREETALDVSLARALEAGDVTVAVYGLGKMGLPLATVFAERVGDVVGVDVDAERVRVINAGECPLDREPGVPALLAEQVERGRFVATTDGERASADASVHVLIVPTLLTAERTPDLSILLDVLETIAPGIDPGDLLCVECTVPPGTCRDVVVPTVAFAGSVDPGAFGVASCPERTASGRALRDIRGAYPKVVGGVDAASTRAAVALYGRITDNEVLRVRDATTAESVKLFEGLYRDVNIALANELARLTDDLAIDVREAVDAANTQPLCDILDPGPGVGGHCIPWYPYFVMNSVERETPLLRTARAVNDAMPAYTVETLAEQLRRRGETLAGATVAVFGVTYRPGVHETRATPALPVVSLLREGGASVLVVDPLVDDFEAFDARPVALDAVADADVDAAILLTAHEEFDDLDWGAFGECVVVDGRDAIRGETGGAHVYTLGRGVRRDGKATPDSRHTGGEP